jgi:hypothetical protein
MTSFPSAGHALDEIFASARSETEGLPHHRALLEGRVSFDGPTLVRLVFALYAHTRHEDVDEEDDDDET